MNMSYNPQFAKLGDILVHEGIITEDTLLKALDTQKSTKKKLGSLTPIFNVFSTQLKISSFDHQFL